MLPGLMTHEDSDARARMWCKQYVMIDFLNWLVLYFNLHIVYSADYSA